MSRVLTNEQNYYDIAATIRQMKNVNTTYKPREMASALKDIYSNEANGTLPLSFEANGNNLLDYRIDGASGGVGDRTKNLFNIDDLFNAPGGKVGNANCNHVLSLELKPNTTYVFSSSGSGSIDGEADLNRCVYVDGSAVQNTIFNGHPYITETDNTGIISIGIISTRENAQQYVNKVAIIQLEEGSTATDYEPYGYKVPVMVEGKNLLQNTATSQTINGLTFTVNTDGSVTCNGRRENTTTFFTIANVTTSGKIILSGCPSGGSSTSFAMRAFSATVSNPKVYYDIGDSCMLNTPDTYNIDIRIQSNYACDNLTFYPMIRKADIEDDTYEPYIEPTTTNIYLDKPIEENESISLSDTNVDIPTIDGTNVLTINTTVQPSNVYIQAPKDSLEATQIASELEVI